ISMDGRIIGYTKDTQAFTDSVTRIDDIMKAAYGVDTAKVSDEFKIQHVPVFDKVESSGQFCFRKTGPGSPGGSG
ncbi:hypothetical protein, partial [Eubacterium aggregans]